MKEHHFGVEEAEKYGIEKAILLHNIRYWLTKNKANKTNIRDGYVWTFNSSRAFAELFPYMKERSISRWLKQLENEGVLSSTYKYNKFGADKTKWYTIPSEFSLESLDGELISQNDLPIRQNGEPNGQNGEPIPDNKQHIVNTNKKQQIKNTDNKQVELSEEEIQAQYDSMPF